MNRQNIALWNPSQLDGFSHSVMNSLRSSTSLSVYDSDRYVVFPGFCDVHVHFREPGFSYKETIHAGSLAAAHGGYTAVCPMPNLNPVPDSVEHLEEELSIIRKDAVINVLPYASITVGQKGKDNRTYRTGKRRAEKASRRIYCCDPYEPSGSAG